MSENKIALLIDSDNISVKYLSGILDELTQYGITTYRRIYGDFTSPTNARWSGKLLEKSIIPIQQFSNTSGKNATDSALIIDAMDLLYNGNVDIFCIVSSDSDFTRLASRLRESGKMIIGMGEKKTPDSFRAACTVFTELENLIDNDSIGMSKETIFADIVNIIQHNDNRGKTTGTGEIGSRLQNKYPDFDIRTFGYTQLSKFLEDMPGIEVIKDNNSLRVRLKNQENEAHSIEHDIIEIVRRHGQPIALSTLGQEIRKRHKGFNVKLYGYSQLYGFIDSIQGLSVIGDRSDRKVWLSDVEAAGTNAEEPVKSDNDKNEAGKNESARDEKRGNSKKSGKNRKSKNQRRNKNDQVAPVTEVAEVPVAEMASPVETEKTEEKVTEPMVESIEAVVETAEEVKEEDVQAFEKAAEKVTALPVAAVDEVEEVKLVEEATVEVVAEPAVEVAVEKVEEPVAEVVGVVTEPSSAAEVEAVATEPEVEAPKPKAKRTRKSTGKTRSTRTTKKTAAKKEASVDAEEKEAPAAVEEKAKSEEVVLEASPAPVEEEKAAEEKVKPKKTTRKRRTTKTAKETPAAEESKAAEENVVEEKKAEDKPAKPRRRSRKKNEE